MHNINKFELPINTTDVDCVTDCWIFNRLIIIKTSPHYNDWIASRYNLYTDASHNFHFGDYGLIEPNYHDDILERKQFNILKIERKKVIEKLKGLISAGYYINIFVKPFKNFEYYHEVVIYGFDNDTNEFSVVGLRNRAFEKYKMPYELLEVTWNDIKKYFMSNSNRGIELSMNYQYPATLFKLNGNFNAENCVVEAYKKLHKELFGKRTIFSTSQKLDFYTEKNIYYSGIECLNAASHMIKKELQGEAFADWFRGITSAIKKLYEHRKMILISMNYIYTKWNICMNDDTLVYINQYNECLKKVEKWVNLALHYELTKNKRDLEVILKELSDVYDVEKDVLGKYVYHTIDWEKYNLNSI